MKHLLLATVLLLVTVCINAQGFSKEKANINLGIGITGWGIPVYCGLDYKVNKDFTIGGEFSYRSFGADWNGHRQENISEISGNLNYHFNRFMEIPKNVDIYAGISIGFFTWSNPYSNQEKYSSGIGMGVQLGGRYYFSNKMGLNIEFDGGNERFGGKVGLTFKL